MRARFSENKSAAGTPAALFDFGEGRAGYAA
jgi:hypothetical protein